MELPDRSQARSWEGKDVVDRDGQRLGRCVGVFADTATGMPEWLHVDVEGHVRSFVPALEAAEDGGTVRVRFGREAVLGAPSVGDDEQLSKAEEIELYRHYGVPVESGEGSVLPAGDASADTATVDTATTGAPAPVVGTSERTSTAAASSSGADTSVAESDALSRDRDGDVTALTPGDNRTTDDGATSALSDSASGGVVTPTTGVDLPVLDPAAASTPVPEDQVTYVDTSQDRVPDAAPPAPEQPRPALRRVPPASPPPAQPAPPAPSSDLSALTPLGAVAGVAAAVALALQARDRRARRRASATARAGRLGSSLRAGSAVALASAGNSLAGVPDAAAQTRRTAALATTKASRAAAKRQKKAAAAARRQRAQTAAALAVASRAAAQRTQSASASLGAATHSASQSAAKAAAKQRKAAAASLTAASKAAAQQKKAAAGSLSSASSRKSSAADTVAAVPARVAKRGRKARKSVARTLWNTVVLGAAGGGYVLGAKAGRQRYDELAQVASAVAESPKVQSATEALSDPERRADLLAEVQQQAGSLVGRRGEPRS